MTGQSEAGKRVAGIGTGLAVVLLAGAASAAPTITSLTPPTLSERVGDHVAFVAAASGSGTLTYQWYQAGTLLAGQTAASLSLTNIQTSSAGTYTLVVGDSSATFVTNSVTLNVTSGYLPLYATNLVVARVGDGVQTLSGATGNTLYLDQYTPSGVYVSTIQIPDEGAGKGYGTGGGNSTSLGSGSSALTVQGGDVGSHDYVNGAVLTVSTNNQYLTLAGYCEPYPFSGADVSVGATAGAYWRGIYTVNAFGYYTLAYTNSGLYSGGNHTIRGAVSTDGTTNFWTAGQAGSGGIKYVNKGVASYLGGNGIPSSGASATGVRVVNIFNGNLVYSDTASIYAFNGIPTAAASGNIGTGTLLISEGGKPNDFALSPDGQTIYIADGLAFTGTSAQAGGIQRWDVTPGTGAFSYSYTLPVLPNNATNGAQNLTVTFPSTTAVWGPGVDGATIYATSAGVSGNSLVSLVDEGSGSVPTVLVAAPAGEALRGVRFGPGASAPVFVAVPPPAAVTNVQGATVSLSVTAGGSAPYTYQWLFNGASIAGATQATLNVTNIQVSQAGNYSVIVANPNSSATSSVSVVTVALGPPVVTVAPRSVVEAAGDHFALVPQVTGSQPLTFVWRQGSTIVGTNLVLGFTNAQPANSGTYTLAISNSYGSTNVTAQVTVTTGVPGVSSNNLVVLRIGDGAQPLDGGLGNTVYLDQYTPAGAYVSTIQVPDEGTGLPYGAGGANSAALPWGSQPLLLPGAGADAGYEGFLTLSADGASLNFAGYVLGYPYNGADVTSSAGNGGNEWRGIGSVDLYGYYSQVWTNSGLYSGGAHTVRSAVTLDQQNYWTAGQAGSGGIKALTVGFQPANGGGIPAIGASSAAGTRVVQILNGSVVYSDAQASTPGLYTLSGTVGFTLPTLLLPETNSPTDFAISPDGQTVYVADNGTYGGATSPAGGIQRWDASAGGGYTYNYTLGTGTGSTVGARGLNVLFPAAITTWGPGVIGATLWATTAESSGNRLIKIVDSGAGAVASVLATAPNSEILSGLRFGPSALATAGIFIDVQPQTVYAGQSATFSVDVYGSGPYTAQWYLNGTNAIPGATDLSLTLNNVSLAQAGNYSVNLTNAVSATASSTAALTVLPLPVFSPSVYLGSGNGYQLNFTGPAGVAYSIWTTTNLSFAPVRTAWSNVLTGGYFSGSLDQFVDPNGGTNAQQFYLLTIP